MEICLKHAQILLFTKYDFLFSLLTKRELTCSVPNSLFCTSSASSIEESTRQARMTGMYSIYLGDNQGVLGGDLIQLVFLYFFILLQNVLIVEQIKKAQI